MCDYCCTKHLKLVACRVQSTMNNYFNGCCVLSTYASSFSSSLPSHPGPPQCKVWYTGAEDLVRKVLCPPPTGLQDHSRPSAPPVQWQQTGMCVCGPVHLKHCDSFLCFPSLLSAPSFLPSLFPPLPLFLPFSTLLSFFPLSFFFSFSYNPVLFFFLLSSLSSSLSAARLSGISCNVARHFT